MQVGGDHMPGLPHDDELGSEAGAAEPVHCWTTPTECTAAHCLQRLAVELELPLAAARRRSRERSRSSSGELPAGLGDGMSAWGSYLSQTSAGGHSNGQPGSRAAPGPAAPGGGSDCSSGGDGGMEVGSFSPSRRRPPPGLRGVLEDEEAPADADEDAPRRPRLGRDSMGSDAGDAAGSPAS